MVLSKPIYLCTSIDDDGDSVFNGYIANVALFTEVSEHCSCGGRVD